MPPFSLVLLEGATPDPNDAATKTCTPPPGRDYTRFLNAGGLKGARIGIPRAFFYDKITPPGGKEPRGGLSAEQAKVMAEAIAILKEQGAIIVDPADLPSVISSDPKANTLLWNICTGLDGAKGKDADCSVVFKYGMKRDFNQWLASLGAKAPVKNLTELREWNVRHQKAGAIKYGQANLDISDEMDVETDRARYQADRAKDLLLSATQGIDAVMKEHRWMHSYSRVPMATPFRPSRAIPRSSCRLAWCRMHPRPPSLTASTQSQPHSA